MALLDGPNVLGYRLQLDGLPAFTGGMGKARHEMQGAMRGGEALDRHLKGLGGTLLRFAAPILGGAGIKKAVDSAMADARAVGRLGTLWTGPTQGLDAYIGRLDVMARRVGIEDDLLAERSAEAIQKGIKEGEAYNFMEQSAKTAQSTYQDLGGIIRATTNTLNTYSMGADRAGRVQAVLWAGVKSGAGSFESLAQLIGKRGEGVASLGVGFEDLVAVAATLGRSGIVGEESLGSVHILLNLLLKTSEEQQAIAKEAGLSWDMASLKAQGFGNWLQTMGSQLQRVKDRGGDVATVLANLGMEPMAQSVFLTLTKNAGAYLDELRGMTDAERELNELWKKRQQNPDFQRQQMGVVGGQMWEAAGIGILKGFAGADVNASVNQLAQQLPKFEAAGATIGSAADTMLKAAMILIEGKGGVGLVDVLTWVGGGAASLWAGMKVGQLGTGMWGAGKYLAGSSAGASAARGALGPAVLGASMPLTLLAGINDTKAGTILEPHKHGAALAEAFNAGTVDAMTMVKAGRYFDDLIKDMRNIPPEWQKGVADSADVLSTAINRASIEWTRILAEDAQRSALAFMSDYTLSQVLAQRSDPRDLHQSLHIRLDHTMTDQSDKRKNHAARARVSGAGRAEINQQYRFFVVHDAQGVNEVRPLPRDVAIAHVRRGYND